MKDSANRINQWGEGALLLIPPNSLRPEAYRCRMKPPEPPIMSRSQMQTLIDGAVLGGTAMNLSYYLGFSLNDQSGNDTECEHAESSDEGTSPAHSLPVLIRAHGKLKDHYR